MQKRGRGDDEGADTSKGADRREGPAACLQAIDAAAEVASSGLGPLQFRQPAVLVHEFGALVAEGPVGLVGPLHQQCQAALDLGEPLAELARIRSNSSAVAGSGASVTPRRRGPNRPRSARSPVPGRQRPAAPG